MALRWTGDKAIRERCSRVLLLAEVRYRNPYQTRAQPKKSTIRTPKTKKAS
jgi:hypothetical protein